MTVADDKVNSVRIECGETAGRRGMTELLGWQPDPSGQHEFRYYYEGGPTTWVSSGGMVSNDISSGIQGRLKPTENVPESHQNVSAASVATGAQPAASIDSAEGCYTDPTDSSPLRFWDAPGWPEEAITSASVPKRDEWLQQPTEHSTGTAAADRPDQPNQLSSDGYLDSRSGEGWQDASSARVPQRTAWSAVFIFGGATYLLGESVDAQLVGIWDRSGTERPPVESWDRSSVGRDGAVARFIELEPDGEGLEAPLVCTWFTQPGGKPLPGLHHRTEGDTAATRLRGADRRRQQSLAGQLRTGVIASGHLRVITPNTSLWEGERAIVQYGARRLKVVETSFTQPGRKHVVGGAALGGVLAGPLGALGGAATSKAQPRNMVRTERKIVNNGALIFTDHRLLFVSSRKHFSPQSHLTIKYGEVSRALFTTRQFLQVRRMQLTLTFKNLRPEETFIIDGTEIDDAMAYYNGIVRFHNDRPDG